MYSSLGNQLLNIGRYLLAYSVLFLVISRLVFSAEQKDKLDNTVGNYVKMVFFLIVLGYLLVLLKLFEVLALAMVFITLSIYMYLKKQELSGIEYISKLQVFLYDVIDRRIILSEIIINWFKNKLIHGKHQLKQLSGWSNAIIVIMLCVTLFYSAYVRFYDAVINAAPAMSDAYVTLAWMKYINQRILFYDGIYPQGFHIILATIQKFAAVDPLYVLKYTGPLNGVLITGGLCYFVYRFTGRIIPGIITASVYGIFGELFVQDWIRQASTNSQEFAFVFIFPALYFYSNYVFNEKYADIKPAIAATIAAGLTHSLAFAYIGMGMGLLGFAALVTDPCAKWKKVVRLFAVGIISVLVSLIPLGVGLLMGKSFHGSSAEYLVSQASQMSVPQLEFFDYAALISLGLILLALPFKRDRSRNMEFFIFLLGAASFVLYYWGGVLTHSVVVSSRADDLWVLTIPVCLGMGWNALSHVLPLIKKKTVETLLCVLIMLFVFFNFRPDPILPYKMEHNSNVEQYLRISKTYKPTTWMIVSQEEGYALVLGKGWHLMLQDFLQHYDPCEEKLVRRVGGTDDVLTTQDVFIYEEKNLFTTSFENLQAVYERRKKEKEKLSEWLKVYQSGHDNLSVFYEDEDIRIWHIHQSLDQEEKFQEIWGAVMKTDD